LRKREIGDYTKAVRTMAYHCYKRLEPWARVKYGLNDLEQEGMMVLLKAYPEYDPTRGASFKTWLTICLRNHYGNIVKKENRNAWLRKDWLYGCSDPQEDPSRSIDDDPLYYSVYKYLNAADCYSPEDAAIFKQAVEALSDAAPDFVELALGTCPRAVRGRLKVFTSAVRLRNKRNRTNEFKPRTAVFVTGRMLADFLGYKKSFLDFKKLLYNVIK